jgi:hypothetical protein
MLLVVVVVASAFVSCAPEATTHKGLDDPWFNEDSPPTITGDLDEAEARWRKELPQHHLKQDDPDALLTDDPPDSPDAYGNVASEDEKQPGSRKSFWDNVGHATFAALTVIVTIGMAVAPYFLMI